MRGRGTLQEAQTSEPDLEGTMGVHQGENRERESQAGGHAEQKHRLVRGPGGEGKGKKKLHEVLGRSPQKRYGGRPGPLTRGLECHA